MIAQMTAVAAPATAARCSRNFKPATKPSRTTIGRAATSAASLQCPKTSSSFLKLAKALVMLPGTLFALLTISLLAVPYFQPPLPLIVGSVSERIQDSSSIASQQYSSSDKYTLRGTVVNSVTGESIRGALVQIY